jgi:hypothetical protein
VAIARERGVSVSELLRAKALGTRLRPTGRRSGGHQDHVHLPAARGSRGAGAAELERTLAGDDRSGSAAPIPSSEGAAAGGHTAAAGRAVQSAGAVAVFRCPFPACGMEALSPRAVCPAHGRKVVAV